jgi:predicted transcriptional regulator
MKERSVISINTNLILQIHSQKYEIGKELGLLDTAEIDRVVNILVGDGFIANNEVTDSKIRITEEGKNRLENNQI